MENRKETIVFKWGLESSLKLCNTETLNRAAGELSEAKP